MGAEQFQAGLLLKRSPFLVIKRVDDGEVRVFSRLHGNLSPFTYDIGRIFGLFDSPSAVSTVAAEMEKISGCDPLALADELYRKRFLVDAREDEKAMVAEYMGAVRLHNRIPRVSKVTFLLSARCNLACRECYHSFFDFRSANMNEDLAAEILEGLFPYLKKRGIPELLISFLGYEPLLSFDLMTRIYDRARRMGEEYGIGTFFKVYTNAFTITETVYTWMEKNRPHLGFIVSLDGIREDNDKNRVDHAGRGTHDRVLANLKRILATGVQCAVLTVLSKLNLANIEKFVDELASVGLKTIFANIFCGQSAKDRLFELTTLEKFGAIKRMDMAAERYDMEFSGEWKFGPVQMITGAHFHCPAGLKQLVFSADGVIYPCQRFAGTDVNFGAYTGDFWEKLGEGRCESYNSWTTDLYDVPTERAKAEGKTDLSGCSCPYVPFMRGMPMAVNLERDLNDYLTEYYLSRPIDRLLSKTSMSY